ncbi:MAG TPA: carboxypeptidase-like regulatory domain-containing protein [Bacteroidales bacterium]|nr:carboxypeptidase-like regulatory domain-containing protein [Bacteroidales bacterium]
MKTLKNVSLIAVLLMSLMTIGTAFAGNSDGRKKINPQDYITIRGKVIDANTKAPLIFASVTVKESNVGIVTNIDGEFTLKVSPSTETLEVSYLGYKNLSIAVSSLKENGAKNTIEMESAPIPIKEIIVKPVDPWVVVEKAISNISDNYENIPNLMTAFYRETIRKNRSYVSIGEAVVEIFKAPYSNDLRFDGTRIYKGRKSSDVEKMDTVLFKLQGGPVTVLQLDIAKNTESVLTLEAMENYDYLISGVIEIDGKPHYIIDFKQKPSVEHPLFMGSLFINMETFGITEAEFGFNLENKEAAASIFIRKKPLGMKIYPEIATYRTKFREQNGKLHFIYSRAEVKFKVDWEKKLFHTYYTTMSEIAVTDRTDQEVIKFAKEEKIKYSDVFSEKVTDFTDKEFWGDYNVIEPDQSIETAIRRLSRKLKFNDR